MRRRPLDLIRIIVQTNHLAARESRYLSCRFPDTAPDVKHSHGSVDADSVSEVVFVAR
jgi:hypothetical protein